MPLSTLNGVTLRASLTKLVRTDGSNYIQLMVFNFHAQLTLYGMTQRRNVRWVTCLARDNVIMKPK